ncbi:MAG: DNA-3-methyladenine glycosylase 2 family protein [Clostridia bacterium]|nr:DNA-3-methyladenine glycosylase 2 family protein [Clostridia bacterium]
MKIIINGNNLELHDITNFILSETLDCGQAFRWQECGDNIWQGVAFGRYLKIGSNNGVITLFDTTKEDFELIWKDYFDLERDYAKILSVLSQNEVLKTAGEFACGIRILRQEPWEALCSFIISQNNNIPRIKGIIDRLCQNFGEQIVDGVYSFPTAEKIASLSLEDLAILKSGFRAKYILDAAKKVASREIVLDKLKDMPLDTAREELVKIYGVGEKVADCTLLFGLSHIDAFPKDVWIKRAVEKLFDGVLPECAIQYAGIAQQYIFHYARMTKLDI